MTYRPLQRWRQAPDRVLLTRIMQTEQASMYASHQNNFEARLHRLSLSIYLIGSEHFGINYP